VRPHRARFLIGPLLLAALLPFAVVLPPVAPSNGAVAAAVAVDPALDQSQARIAPGRLIVKFRAGAAPDAVERAVALEAVEDVQATRVSGARALTVPPGQEHAIAARLRANPDVEYAEPDYVAHRTAAVPGDPFYAAAQLDLPKVGVSAAWDVTLGSASVTVGVLDQGISTQHPDLIGQWTYAGGATPGNHVLLSSPLSEGCSVPIVPEDDGWLDTLSGAGFTHGAHVSGTIAANSTIVGGPAVGIAGMAPGVRVVPIKVLDCQGSGYFSDIAAGISFAASRGIRVVNMSLSGLVPSGCPPFLQQAIDNATAAGTLVVAAVGNSGSSAVEFPAGCANVLGVGATTLEDGVPAFSQRNGTVDIVAPGVGITSTYRAGNGDYGYAMSSGTSMASPHVAACAALIYSAKPGIQPAAVQQHLFSTAVDLGLVGRDDTFGYGRLSCGAAVQQAVATAAASPSPITNANCSDFATWSQAQAFFIAQGGPAADPHGLDTNHNGIACESLPGAPGNTATATALAQTTPTATPGQSATPTSPAQPGSPTATMTVTSTPTVTPTPSNTAPPAPTATIPPGAERFEDNSSAITYSAGWTQVLDAAASAGHYRRSAQPGSTASFSFTGSGGSVLWAAERGPGAGRADISLDGAFIGTVDLYAPQVEPGFVTAFPAAPNHHTLRVTVRGDANPAATGADVSVDYFDVVDVVGGRGFAIRRDINVVLEGVVASWLPGSAQSGYYLARVSAAGTALLPGGGMALPATATTYADFTLAADGIYCYSLLPLAGAPAAPIGNSDLLCGMRGTRSGLAPGGLSVRLDQSSRATLNWSVPIIAGGAPPSFALIVLGPEPEVIPMPPGSVQASHETGGAARCYAVLTMAGSTTIGVSDVVCAIPGLAHL